MINKGLYLLSKCHYLINEGNLGLIKAVQRFDETRGFRFISYAVWWISQSIRQAINKTGRTIRLPSNVTDNMGKLYRQSLELEQVYEREPSSEELAEISDTTISWIEGLIQSYSNTYSLDEPLENSTSTRLDFLESNDERPEAKIFSDLYGELTITETSPKKSLRSSNDGSAEPSGCECAIPI